MPEPRESLNQIDRVRQVGSILGGVAVTATLENFIPSGLAFGAAILSVLPLNYILLTLGVHRNFNQNGNREQP